MTYQESKWKKRIAGLLCCGMTVSMLVGCGGKTEVQSGQQPSDGPVTQEGYSLPISEEGMELTYAGPDNWYASASYASNLEVWQEFEKRTGIKIKFEVMPQQQYDTSMQTRVAANQGLPDIIAVPPLWNSDTVKYADNGIIQPLNRLIGQYGVNIEKFFQEYPELKECIVAADGEIYTIPESTVQMNDYNFNMPIIRQDWLDKLGLSVPQTWDEWYQVLKAFKTQDPNGNGKADEIGFYAEGIAKTDFFAAAQGIPMSDSGFMVDESGKVRYIPATQEYREMLSFVNRLYTEGLLELELGATKKEEFINQDILGAHTHWSLITTRFNTSLEKAGIAGKYAAVLPPRDEKGNTVVAKRLPISLEYAITKDCKDSAAAIKWIDYVYASEEGLRLQAAGIEGKSYNMVDGKPVLSDWTLHHPDGIDPLNALRSLGAGGSVLYNQPWEIGEQLYTEDALAFADQAKPYVQETFPRILGTVEEENRIFAIMADMKTYCDEMIVKFAIGQEPLDGFDKFVDMLNGMGLEELLSIKQTQYDRLQEMK